VVGRPGHRYEIPEGARVHSLENVELPVSSSDIRARFEAGDQRLESPAAVLHYIAERKLYLGQMGR
jgi:nicotinic acid mononucleotide adenylyltransferase